MDERREVLDPGADATLRLFRTRFAVVDDGEVDVVVMGPAQRGRPGAFAVDRPAVEILAEIKIPSSELTGEVF